MVFIVMIDLNLIWAGPMKFSERNIGCNSPPHMLMVELMRGGCWRRWEMLCPAIPIFTWKLKKKNF